MKSIDAVRSSLLEHGLGGRADLVEDRPVVVDALERPPRRRVDLVRPRLAVVGPGQRGAELRRDRDEGVEGLVVADRPRQHGQRRRDHQHDRRAASPAASSTASANGSSRTIAFARPRIASPISTPGQDHPGIRARVQDGGDRAQQAEHEQRLAHHRLPDQDQRDVDRAQRQRDQRHAPPPELERDQPDQRHDPRADERVGDPRGLHPRRLVAARPRARTRRHEDRVRGRPERRRAPVGQREPVPGGDRRRVPVVVDRVVDELVVGRREDEGDPDRQRGERSALRRRRDTCGGTAQQRPAAVEPEAREHHSVLSA